MHDKGKYIKKPLHQVESLFIKHNQPTTIYTIHVDYLNRLDGPNCKTLLRKFGTNEGGPSYTIYVDKESIILKIEEI